MFEHCAQIISNKEVAAGTYLMRLRSPDMARAARAGQFVMIRVRPGRDPLLRRPFSIAGVEQGELLLILYRVVGRGTEIMAQTRERERIWVLGPLGKGFTTPQRDHLSLLVAGGMGLAPLLFLAQAIHAGDARLMLGFGTAAEMVALEHFGDVGMDVSTATDDGTAGHAGPVTDLLGAFLEGEGQNKRRLCIFACGPGPMLKKVAAMALEQGIACQASLEAAMACGLGACQGCAVKAAEGEQRAYYHVCADGPVFPVGAIDWGGL